MKKIFKTIGIIGILAILLCGAYLLGTSQTKTVIEEKEVEKPVEVVPDGYINTKSKEFYNNYIDMRQVTGFDVTENGLQLYFSDGNGYYWER